MEFDIFNVFALIGGVALFLYGMHVMGNGLEKLSGGRLESILEKLTDNPIKAVLLGAGITVALQSSSSTTVMLVGFVNSGIMRLSQVIGVILGSNIGTCATTWFLALTGIDDGNNMLLKLIKPSSFAPLLAMLGVVFVMFLKSERKAVIGNILIGFSLLMIGMSNMSNAVSPLGDNKAFQELFTKFSFPILGILVGAILTAIIQSSAASIGILQSLALTGIVTNGAAIPIIMGQNIGTCITAILSSIGTSKNAKRVAVVHLCFNVIGTVVFSIIYYSLDAIFNFSFADQSTNIFGIAALHTIFNLAGTIMILPFTKGLEKIACLIIRDDKNEPETIDNTFAVLDDRLLSSPTFAIEHCKKLVHDMARITKDNFNLSLELLGSYSKEKAKAVIESEDKVDIYEDRIGTYLVKLSSQSLSAKDSQNISLLLHSISDIERISDHSVNLVATAKSMHKKEASFSAKAQEELKVLYNATTDILNRTLDAFEKADISLAKTVEPLEEVIDTICSSMKKRHIKRLKKGKCSVDLGFLLNDILANTERVSDHCSNIALCLIQIQENVFDTHEYVINLKKEQDDVFEEQFAMFAKKYQLPKQKSDDKTDDKADKKTNDKNSKTKANLEENDNTTIDNPIQEELDELTKEKTNKKDSKDE